MSDPEAARLEQLWSGPFGDAYVERNRAAGDPRAPFWHRLLARCTPRHVLEVGCNVGANLRWILPPGAGREPFACGIDVNVMALGELRRALPAAHAVRAAAGTLPFRDRQFDLTLTLGVLIHQPESALEQVMAEVARCSARYVLCGEYFAEETTEVPYRGQTGALFKRDYGAFYPRIAPELVLCEQGFLGRDEGWDDVHWWLFERR